MYKALIIDDNHSFIDSFKVMLKGMPVYFEKASRFHEGKALLTKSGTYINKNVVSEILNFNQSVMQSEKKDEVKVHTPKPIEIKSPPFNTEGYLFLFVEQHTESGMKGLQFINEIMRSGDRFNEENIFLFSSNISQIEAQAKKLGINCFEKPIRINALKPVLTQRIQKLQSLESNINQMVEKYKIQIAGESVKKKRSKMEIFAGAGSSDSDEKA